MEDKSWDEKYSYSVYQHISNPTYLASPQHNYNAPYPNLDRQQETESMMSCESGQLDRTASPYPTSLSPSDYCQSAASEQHVGSSQESDEEDESGAASPYGEVEGEMEEDEEDDLSSEPPPQRSDGVSDRVRWEEKNWLY
jgi:hypothetical protein